jgi:hypothetical protein
VKTECPTDELSGGEIIAIAELIADIVVVDSDLQRGNVVTIE